MLSPPLKTAILLATLLTLYILIIRYWTWKEDINQFKTKQKNFLNKFKTTKQTSTYKNNALTKITTKIKHYKTFLIILTQKKQIIEQTPAFLQALSNALSAGFTLPKALTFIADEINEPLKSHIKNINQQIELQIPIEIALQNFAKDIQNPEITFFTESTIINLKTGGNLIKLFKKISHLIEEKLKLKRDIKSFTAQGKLSGILIAILWPISLIFFKFCAPEHTNILFQTQAGHTLLAISIALEITGFLFIWKIIKIKI